MIQRLDELCEQFDLSREALNLDLGPLGPLLSRE
jgi:Gas vesicle protein K